MDINLQNSNFSTDPIANFYEKYKTSSNQIITQTTTEWLKNIKDTLNDILLQHQNQIKQLQNEINQRYTNEEIKIKKIQNIFIIIFCFLIVGLCFLTIYWNNKSIIKNFEEFKKEKDKEIQNQKEDLFNIVHSNLSSLRTSDLLSQIFMKYGLKLSYKPDIDNLLKNKFKLQNLLLVDKANVVYWRNSSIYDLNIKELNIRNVVTKNSITVSDWIGNEFLERTITATHTEPTPFVDSFNQICLISNYLQPQFSFISAQRVKEIKEHKRNGVITSLNNNHEKTGDFQSFRFL